VISLRRGFCSALTFVGLHSQDCEHCTAIEKCWGLDMRRRLAELNEQANQSAKAVEHEIQRSSNDAA
jgi:hypothetical protein